MGQVPKDDHDWPKGAWAQCKACGRLKRRCAYTKNQQANGGSRRCRICISNNREWTDDADTYEANYQKNNTKWQDKTFARLILKKAFPVGHQEDCDRLHEVMTPHWEALRAKGLLTPPEHKAGPSPQGDDDKGARSHSRGSGDAPAAERAQREDKEDRPDKPKLAPPRGARRTGSSAIGASSSDDRGRAGARSGSPGNSRGTRRSSSDDGGRAGARSGGPGNSRGTRRSSSSSGNSGTGEYEYGPAAPSKAAFDLHREGTVCVYNVTVPPTAESSAVAESACRVDLVKDLADGPGSIICIQRADPDMAIQMNNLPPPEGLAQRFYVLLREGLMIATRATLALALAERVLKKWPDVGAMLVADVHFRRPVAGFQVLTLANLSLNSHGSGDEDTALDSLKVVAADIVQIIVNRRVRVLTGDFGRGLFALVNLIRGSGVGLEVAAWRPGTDGLDGQPFVDSCVVCLVGPATKVKLKTPSLDPTSMNTLPSTSSHPLADFTRGSGGFSARWGQWTWTRGWPAVVLPK